MSGDERVERECRSFAELFRWHLDRGTRPSLNTSRSGSRWLAQDFAYKVGVDKRTVTNWRNGVTLPFPVNLSAIETVLFGDNNDEYEVWRSQLRRCWDTAKWKNGLFGKPLPVVCRGAVIRSESNTQSESEEEGISTEQIIYLRDALNQFEEALFAFKRQVNAPRLVFKLDSHLNGLRETAFSLKTKASAGEEFLGLEMAIREIEEGQFVERFGALGFRALSEKIGAIVEQCKRSSEKSQHIVDNEWDKNDNIPHNQDVLELLYLINEKIDSIKNISFASYAIKIEIDTELRRLRRFITSSRLPLSDLEASSRRMEELDRYFLRDIITTGQIIIGYYAKNLPPFSRFRNRLPNGVATPEMVVIPEGVYRMGAEINEPESYHAEIVPTVGKREMIIPKRFALGRYPITFEEFATFCDAVQRDVPEHEGWGDGRRPIINVSWFDAMSYVNWINEAVGTYSYGLPPESVWEYACRAGTNTRRWWGDNWETDRANGDRCYGGGRTSSVDQYPPNPWGLHDMLGNVWEWCADLWSGNIENLPHAGQIFSIPATEEAPRRVCRGSSWDNLPGHLRCAFRLRLNPEYNNDDLGFRLFKAL